MLGYGQGAGALTVTGLPIPYTPLNFGQLTSGQTAQQTLILTNNGNTPITLHRITSDPPFLTTATCLTTLTPDSTCTVTLTYAPIYELPTTATNLTTRSDTGTLILESDAANSPTLLDFTGTVVPILSTSPASSSILATFQLSQSSLTFPTTAIGSASPTQTITLTNTGTTTLHILNTLTSTGFTTATTCTTLTPGTTCPFNIQFTPTPSSPNTGTLEIQSDASTSLEFITLLGTSSASPLTLNPTTLNFGTVNVSSSGQLTLQIINTTAAPITVTNISTTPGYTANNTCLTLTPAAACTLTVTFTPTTTGILPGTLSLSSNATALPLSIPLTGTGAIVQPQNTPGSFTLTVGGNTSQAITINSGSPAVYNLNLIPINNFTGAVALTCTPVAAAQYATCSLLFPTLTLNGTTAQTSIATINTITSEAAYKIAKLLAFLLIPTLFIFIPKRKVRAAALASLLCIAISACGGGANPGSGSKILYTPAGTYQYNVTASSTSGPTVSSTVTLNLIVQ